MVRAAKVCIKGFVPRFVSQWICYVSGHSFTFAYTGTYVHRHIIIRTGKSWKVGKSG